MTPYANISGKSGVAEYEIGDGYIKVRFARDRTIYVYDLYTPGADVVEEMKALAVAGEGLATYIARHVKDNYSRTE
jgi:hypothetical protein